MSGGALIRTGLALLLALLAAPAVAAPAPELPAALRGDHFAIRSAATRHDYEIYVRTPEGYDESPGKTYPIVYLLDGDSLFPALAPQQLFMHYDDSIEDALVVGIAYGSFDAPKNVRSRDFNAGAADFANFLAKELIPAVERRVRADPRRRILVGQSRGGTYVLFDAFTQPDLFWARIASNPTLDHPRLNQPPAAARRGDLRLYVASGESDRAPLRERALAAFAQWAERERWPWRLSTTTIPGGTHAADIARVYRWAIRDVLAPAKP